MADKKPKWDASRVFILVIVVTFFLTTFAFSGIVIWQLTKDGDNKPQDAAAQTAQSCTSTQAEETLSAPEVYKPSGDVTKLEKTTLTPGSGQTAKAGDCVVAKYYGTLASDGKLFDENFTQPTAFAFTLGAGNVIPGWDQGLIGMKVGETRRLVIPSELAYRDQAMGEDIPANSDLVFVVKLLGIKDTRSN